MSLVQFTEMLGAVIVSVAGAGRGSNRLELRSDDGRTFGFMHVQDCCESVSIEDVCGDVADLIGSPIVLAEEVSSEAEPAPDRDGYTPESYTWSFYRFGTAKGTVTVRWLGESNGYYSESVEFFVDPSREAS